MDFFRTGTATEGSKSVVDELLDFELGGKLIVFYYYTLIFYFVMYCIGDLEDDPNELIQGELEVEIDEDGDFDNENDAFGDFDPSSLPGIYLIY